MVLNHRKELLSDLNFKMQLFNVPKRQNVKYNMSFFFLSGKNNKKFYWLFMGLVLT